MHIERPEKRDRSGNFDTRYSKSEEYGAFSDHVDTVFFQTYGKGDDVYARYASINTPSLSPNAGEIARDVREVLLGNGVALKSEKRRDAFTISAGSSDRDADKEPHIDLSFDKDEIVAFRLGRWAEDALSDSLTIERARAYGKSNPHALTFKSGEEHIVELDKAPAYTGAVKSGVDYQATSLPHNEFARAIQGSGKFASAKIAESVLEHVPGEKGGLVNVLTGLIAEKETEIRAQVEQELENQSVLSNALSVLVTAGYIGAEDANAIIDDQIEHHGASVAAVQALPRDKDRIQSAGIYEPNDAEKVRAEIAFNTAGAPIQRITEKYYFAEIGGKPAFDLNTALTVPLGAADILAAQIDDVVSVRDIPTLKSDKEKGTPVSSRIVVKGGIHEVVTALAEKGLVPNDVAAQLGSQFDKAVIAYDEDDDQAPAAPAAAVALPPAPA